MSYQPVQKVVFAARKSSSSIEHGKHMPGQPEPASILPYGLSGNSHSPLHTPDQNYPHQIADLIHDLSTDQQTETIQERQA